MPANGLENGFPGSLILGEWNDLLPKYTQAAAVEIFNGGRHSAKLSNRSASFIREPRLLFLSNRFPPRKER